MPSDFKRLGFGPNPSRFDVRTFEVSRTCRFLFQPAVDPALLLVALHGYGSNPEDMLRLTAAAAGTCHAIAALQAPNEQYLSSPGQDTKSGYNWGVQEHRSEAIELHHRMLSSTLGLLQTECGLSPQRTVLLGFSQAVGLNYRFAAKYPGATGGVVGICGGVPADWQTTDPGRIDAAVLHIARMEDEFYPAERAAGFATVLRRHADDVEFHMIPGNHRFPSKTGRILQPWLGRVFAPLPAEEQNQVRIESPSPP